MPTPKNDKRRMKRKKKRRAPRACLQRSRPALGGKNKNFLILELIERAGGDVSTIVYTLHDGALRGSVMDLHRKYRRYLRSLLRRTYSKHARAHARARKRVDRIVRGRGPAGRVHDIFLLQAAEKIRREIEREERNANA